MTSAVETPLERRARCVAMRQSGMTYRRIAEALGVSVPRAEQIVTRGLRDIADVRAAALHALSSPLRAELLIRRALAVWSAHDQERT